MHIAISGIIEVYERREQDESKEDFKNLSYHQHCACNRFCGEVRGGLRRLFADEQLGAFFALGGNECLSISAPCNHRLCNQEGPAEERKINPASENAMDTQIKKLSVTLAPRAF